MRAHGTLVGRRNGIDSKAFDLLQVWVANPEGPFELAHMRAVRLSFSTGWFG